MQLHEDNETWLKTIPYSILGYEEDNIICILSVLGLLRIGDNVKDILSNKSIRSMRQASQTNCRWRGVSWMMAKISLLL